MRAKGDVKEEDGKNWKMKRKIDLLHVENISRMEHIKKKWVMKTHTKSQRI